VWSVCGCIGALTLSSLSSNNKRVVALSSGSHISTTQTFLIGVGISVTISLLLILICVYSRGTMFLSVGVLFVVLYPRCTIGITGIVINSLLIHFLCLLAIVLGLLPFVEVYAEMYCIVCCVHGLLLSYHLVTIDSVAITGIVVCMEATYLCGVILCNHIVLIGWLT